MTAGRRGRTALATRGSALAFALAIALLAGTALSACAPGATPASSGSATPVGSASPVAPASATVSASPDGSASPAALASPVTGRLVKLETEGLVRVKGFTMRLADGTEASFTIGRLENGVEFPPGHLAEHMASSSAVKVFFRDTDGAHVVYRLEDAE